MDSRLAKTAYLVGVILTAVAGTAVFWKSKPRDTSVEGYSFRLTLPGAWTREAPSASGPLIYHSNKEQLTVSSLDFGKTLTDDEWRPIFEKLVEMHRRATMRKSSNAITLSDTTFANSGGALVARYSGTEPASKYSFYCLLLSSRTGMGIFLYEALDMTDKESEIRARFIMNSIVLTK